MAALSAALLPPDSIWRPHVRYRLRIQLVNATHCKPDERRECCQWNADRVFVIRRANGR